MIKEYVSFVVRIVQLNLMFFEALLFENYSVMSNIVLLCFVCFFINFVFYFDLLDIVGGRGRGVKLTLE